jgi:hypothetical protein
LKISAFLNCAGCAQLIFQAHESPSLPARVDRPGRC